MTTYIHKNFKNVLAYLLGVRNIGTNITPTITTIDGSTKTIDTNSAFIPNQLYLTPSDYNLYNKSWPAFISSSNATLTNENTCPDLLNGFTQVQDAPVMTEGKMTHTYSVANSGATDMVVRKVAVYATTTSGVLADRQNSDYLLYVIDLETPVTIPAGETGIISISLDFSNI